MGILFLNCGGTIDKTYDPAAEIFLHAKTHLPEIFARARISPEIKISMRELFLKDSLDMKKKDFEKVAKNCENSAEKKILVMHGTSKMVESAKLVAQKNLAKTVVFFGAMIPFEIGNSDAMFNFGFALAAVQNLPRGVFVAMNGKIFPAAIVQKNSTEATFESC